MLTGPFLSKNWMASNPDFKTSKWVLMGIPYDGTCSYRPGTRFAPEQIRLASWGLEEYSPYLDKEMSEISFYDVGELDLPFGNREKCLEMIKNNVKEILAQDKFYFGVGGEHLITYPAIEAYLEKYPDIGLIHFDAHTDLREDYLGEKLSHACVIKRISEKIKAEKIVQIGIRSGEKNEFDWMKNNKTHLKDQKEAIYALKKLENIPVFITVDVDVLDPSIMSGTGTPEAGGLTFNEFMEWLLLFKNLNIVGVDVVELSPHYDMSGSSTATAAKIIRELLLMVG
ncbi:MAG: agmatinase [Candidatus Gastranaerophilaceae bacterium]|jgi:agmatinase